MTKPNTEPADLEKELARFQGRTETQLHQIRVLIGLVVLATLLGAWAMWIVIDQRDARQKDVDAQLTALACMVLHYLPPGTSFYTDLAALYPDCPPYVPPTAPAAETLTITRAAPNETVTLTGGTFTLPGGQVTTVPRGVVTLSGVGEGATVVRTVRVPIPGPPHNITISAAPSRIIIAGPTSTTTVHVTSTVVSRETTTVRATLTQRATVTVTAKNGKGPPCPNPPCKK